MGIKIYISSNNGNKELQNHQSRILMILKSLGIEFEAVDVSAPGTEKDRDYMRANGKKKEGDRNVLPPQIFNGDKFCGDYDDFDIANEDDVLEEFLGLPRKTPKVDPTKTDAVAAEPGKLEPGKPEEGAAEGAPAAEGEAAPAEAAAPAVEAAPAEVEAAA
jgi:glutaredoxin